MGGGDIRRMLQLSGRRTKSANEQFLKGKDLEIAEDFYTRCNTLSEKILEGNKSLTKKEILSGLERTGIISGAICLPGRPIR